MKRSISTGLILMVVVAMTLALLQNTRRPVYAQIEDVCFAVADNGDEPGSADTLVTLNRETGETVLIGFTGTSDIEAIAMEPGAGTLYAADGEQLGTLDLNTGEFTPYPNEFGTGSGAFGEVEFDDVDSLTVDFPSGVLYGVHRRRGADMDVMFQINKASSGGEHIPDAFGPGVDYVPIEGPGVLTDVDDIAVDPVTYEMYGASNDGGAGGVLINIDKETGNATVVGAFGVDDIEGLAYFNDGQLYGSTGKFSTGPATRNELYVIDESTGEATFIAAFSEYTDYEALACLTSPTSIALSDMTAGSTAAGVGVVALVAVGLLAAFTLFVVRRKVLA